MIAGTKVNRSCDVFEILRRARARSDKTHAASLEQSRSSQSLQEGIPKTIPLVLRVQSVLHSLTQPPDRGYAHAAYVVQSVATISPSAGAPGLADPLVVNCVFENENTSMRLIHVTRCASRVLD